MVHSIAIGDVKVNQAVGGHVPVGHQRNLVPVKQGLKAGVGNPIEANTTPVSVMQFDRCDKRGFVLRAASPLPAHTFSTQVGVIHRDDALQRQAQRKQRGLAQRFAPNL
tara:strand:- start:14844 stop:15170 length:327 start_codon:yes stop_codon:yes gene_type:complete